MNQKEFESNDENLQNYLNDMTELSRKYGIGLTHECYLYQMQDGSDTDFTRRYRMTEKGYLEFR